MSNFWGAVQNVQTASFNCLMLKNRANPIIRYVCANPNSRTVPSCCGARGRFHQNDGRRYPNLPLPRPCAVSIVYRIKLPAVRFQVCAHFFIAAGAQSHADYRNALARQFVYRRRSMAADTAPRAPEIQHGGTVSAGFGQRGLPPLYGLQRQSGRPGRHIWRAPPVQDKADDDEGCRHCKGLA